MHNKIIYLSHFHYSLCRSFASFCLCFFPFFFYLFFLFSLTLIIGIFYCLNYTLLLHHLIITYLASDLSLSYIIFIVPDTTIGIFYCLDYTSLLLHFLITHLENIFYNNYVIHICPRKFL